VSPNDAQIAHIAYTAGQLDIAAAEQATQKSKNNCSLSPKIWSAITRP
jgi:predicted outer membrane protein